MAVIVYDVSSEMAYPWSVAWVRLHLQHRAVGCLLPMHQQAAWTSAYAALIAFCIVALTAAAAWPPHQATTLAPGWIPPSPAVLRPPLDYPQIICSAMQGCWAVCILCSLVSGRPA